MKKLLIATHNKGKIAELTSLLSDLPVDLFSLKDVGINEDVEETGKTYLENSKLKGVFYSRKSGLPTISDDGGLEISALEGAPGVHSRRWLGFTATDEELIKHMKKVAGELPDNNRVAYFKTVITLAIPDGLPAGQAGKTWFSRGQVKGIIARKPLVSILEGYPYRSFFFLPQIDKFYHESELTDEEMKRFNHRYKAVQKLKPIILEKLMG